MNKIILMGRLTKEPEVRYTTQNNTAVCSFTLAVDRKYQRQGEEKQTDFFNIVAWNKLGEFCGKYFAKGSRVLIGGMLQNRSWTDENGNKHYVTEIIADEAEFADSKKDNNQSNSDDSGFFPDDGKLPF